ncbi:F-box/kelch-repeat protein At3g23880-like [Papaver somniferum]|uniref:F-box/kelch-repeat protein At3g23880-like n=1 Tax=Papaver somniferum TaxID=3469 RepID=UPI000E701BB6|nr:F-box/kelch-repeat protein At3g23880-like [Papaver somniferum]
MVGSCNGLVCYAVHERWIEREKIVYICNPFTGEHIQLPSTKCATYNDYWKSTMIGFGYVHSSHEYKVVSCRYNDWCGKVHVYTLRCGGGCCTGTRWRNKSSMIKEDLTSYFIGLPSTTLFTGGALHWLNQLDSHKQTRVAFDLERETFELLPSLPFKITDNNHVELMELGGDLCVMEIFQVNISLIYGS